MLTEGLAGRGRLTVRSRSAEFELRDAMGQLRVVRSIVSALRASTHGTQFGALIAMLAFAQRYTARADFSNRATAEADLQRTRAFREPNDAESSGVHLILP